MIRKTILMCAALLLGVAAQAQVSSPASGDIMLNVSRGDGTFQSRYVDTVKTGELQFIMFGQDPTPGSITSPPTLRVQQRRLGPSFVCGALNGSTCDVVANNVTIGSSQLNDASPIGRALLTASSGAVALSTIGGASSGDLATGLSGKANASHNHLVSDITDATANGKSLMLMGSPADGRAVLALGNAATANSPVSGNAATSELVLGSDTRLADARDPKAHTHPSSAINDSTVAGRSLLTASDFASQRSLLGVMSVSESNAAYYPLATNPAGYVSAAGARGAISLTTTGSGAATFNQTSGALNIPLPAAQVQPDWNASSGLGSILNKPTTVAGYGLTDAATTSALSAGLATKFNNPTGTAAQYILGNGSLANFPVLPTINRAVVTTTTDGTYTWTLPTACSSGQLPVVSITPEGSANTDVFNHKVTAKSNSSVSILVSRTQVSVASLIGLSVLSIPTGGTGATVVDLIAVCP